LALDGDVAGEEAAVKIGDLFQRAGIHVRVLRLEKGEDPDSILRTKGPVFFETLIHSSFDYLSFLVDKMYHRADVKTPAGKNQVVQALIERIRSWNKPVLVHESLIKLSELLNLPPEVIHMGSVPSLLVKKEGRTSKEYVDADKILEIDLIRLLMFSQQASKEIALLCKKNLKTDQLKIGSCKKLYDLVINTILEQGHIDLLSFGAALEKEEEEEVIVEIMKRKINPLKALESAKLAVKKILDRNWLEEREHIRQKIHSGALSEEEALELAKQFDELKKKQPELII
jgi:DNA primase